MCRGHGVVGRRGRLREVRQRPVLREESDLRQKHRPTDIRHESVRRRLHVRDVLVRPAHRRDVRHTGPRALMNDNSALVRNYYRCTHFIILCLRTAEKYNSVLLYSNCVHMVILYYRIAFYFYTKS